MAYELSPKQRKFLSGMAAAGMASTMSWSGLFSVPAFAEAANPPQFVPRSGTTLVSMFGAFSGSSPIDLGFLGMTGAAA